MSPARGYNVGDNEEESTWRNPPSRSFPTARTASTGPTKVTDPQGNAIDIEDGRAVSLCRCGGSANKPYCDGTHGRIGFQASESVVESNPRAGPRVIVPPLLLAAALLPTGPSAVAPSLAADLDGDGKTESVTAAPGRGVVRLEVRDADGRKLADAKAPAPAGDVVPVALTVGPARQRGRAPRGLRPRRTRSECRTVWRYREGRLTKLPLRDAAGKALPDCATPAGWTARWEGASGGRPAAWVRERAGTVEAGTLATREAYAFAGFSLDYDAGRSAVRDRGRPDSRVVRRRRSTPATLSRSSTPVSTSRSFAKSPRCESTPIGGAVSSRCGSRGPGASSRLPSSPTRRPSKRRRSAFARETGRPAPRSGSPATAPCPSP